MNLRILVLLFAALSFAGRSFGQTDNAIRILNYDSDRPVEELRAYGQFVNGVQLNGIYDLIGVDDKTLTTESAKSKDELFLILRIEATSNAQGVLAFIELEIANDSPIIKKGSRLKVPTLFEGRYVLIEKICNSSDARDGSFKGYGGTVEKNGEPIDYVAKLQSEKPVLRLRSMVTK